ncbi:unnamed protein product, partial [Prunus brigantina]
KKNTKNNLQKRTKTHKSATKKKSQRKYKDSHTIITHYTKIETLEAPIRTHQSRENTSQSQRSQ